MRIKLALLAHFFFSFFSISLSFFLSSWFFSRYRVVCSASFISLLLFFQLLFFAGCEISLQNMLNRPDVFPKITSSITNPRDKHKTSLVLKVFNGKNAALLREKIGNADACATADFVSAIDDFFYIFRNFYLNPKKHAQMSMDFRAERMLQINDFFEEVRSSLS